MIDSIPRGDETSQPQEPTVVQIDPKCLHSALKEFFDPLRTNDSRTDFFAVYRKESEEFDRDYARKYDEDLNTSLIFAGLFSAVSSAFIIDVQSKLQPDPNDATATYMRILIHTMNNSLFPDADPSTITWAGPPPETVTVQCLLYASLAMSLFAAFLAMLGKQWVNRYLRNHGGSAGDKSRDRQRKLDGSEKWHFHLVIESLPVMLQLALLLLGGALSRYLWTTSRTVAGVILAFTLFGITSYVFFTVAATLYYNCPYQTPPSVLTRAAIRYLTRSDAGFARSLRSVISSLPSTKNLGRSLKRFYSGVRSALEGFCCLPPVAGKTEHISVAAVVVSPTRIFEDILINWEACKADARCLSWVLHSTTDPDVILSTVRFVADTVWYPEIAGVLSPHILADLFFDCVLDGRVVPGKEVHAISIGMALVSVLSIQLSIEPESKKLKGLCERISDGSQLVCPWELVPQFEPILELVGMVLKFVAQAVPRAPPWESQIGWNNQSIPENLPTTHKLWLSRVVLQTFWRWRHVQDLPIVLQPFPAELFCERFMADGGQMLVILKTNSFLTMAISLGLRIDIRDLYAPHNNDALQTAFNLFHQQLRTSIREGKADPYYLASALRASNRSDPFQVMENVESGFLWITEILNSDYKEYHRYLMASRVVELLGKHFCFGDPEGIVRVRRAWIPPLLGFLSLSEKFYATESPPYPGFMALCIISNSRISADFAASILPILSSILLPTHPLQSRCLALKAFHTLMPGWFSPQMESVMHDDLDKLLQAVGDPFQSSPDPLLWDWVPRRVLCHKPMDSVVVLIEFASLDLWRNHLRRSNFTSCEEVLSTEKGRRTALDRILSASTHTLLAFLHTPARIITAIRCLEELRCLNTAEVVIMWAWTTGVVNAVDHDGWKLVMDDTLRFYQTHGVGRLTALKQRITDPTMEREHLSFLMTHYESSPCRIGSTKRSIPFTCSSWREPSPRDWTDLCVSRVCQLRKLYHLFGYDLATWKEAAAADEMVVVEEAVVSEEVKEMDMSSGRSVTLVPFADRTCKLSIEI